MLGAPWVIPRKRGCLIFAGRFLWKSFLAGLVNGILVFVTGRGLSLGFYVRFGGEKAADFGQIGQPTGNLLGRNSYL